MITQKYNWKTIEKEPENGFFNLIKEKKLSPLAGKILLNRDIGSEETLTQFLSEDLSQLYSPFLLHDMEKAVNRIRKAIENGEEILVYGDYDADGMTSASIMKEALEMLGAEPHVYLPNRFTDGYGPNESVYQYFIKNQNVSLIITVDNGVAGHEAIDMAQEHGVDVIVTDHHGLPTTLPNAFALIHPEHPNASYPFSYLAGCGVAFKVACALLETIPTDMLDLVAIGTIADMVSLTDENRILVKAGLKQLKQTERIGLMELFAVSGIDISNITEETVGFQIAPQLNALGRLDDPNPAIELLTGFDENDVRDIAKMISDKNEERKAIVQNIYDEAMEMVDLTKPVQVLAKEEWHPGVLGIVAGRILEKIAQPVIVLNIKNGFAKGSARSVDSVDIFHVLNNHRQLFEAFGGHAGAAGMTLKIENLKRLSHVLGEYISDNNINVSQKKDLAIDGILPLSEMTLDTVNSLEKLAPFGMDNPKPKFEVTHFTVKQVRTMGQNGAHLKLKIVQDKTAIDVIAFHQGHLMQEFLQATNLRLVVTLSIHKWNGQTTVQLMLEDATTEGIQLIDIRSKTAKIPEHVPLITDNKKSQEVVVLEVPETAEELKRLFKNRQFDVIYFKNHIKQPYYLTGYGTREQFAKLYKVLYQFPEFDVRYKLKTLSKYLNIPEILLIRMIQIFNELGFVTITNGIMSVDKTATKRDISESQIYQNLKVQVKFQELMALGTPREIYDGLICDDD